MKIKKAKLTNQKRVFKNDEEARVALDELHNFISAKKKNLTLLQTHCRALTKFVTYQMIEVTDQVKLFCSLNDHLFVLITLVVGDYQVGF